MTAYTRAIREVIVGQKQGEEEPIIGDPIGRPGIIADLGFEIVASTPEQFTAFQAAEFARWQKLIQSRNIKVE